jgi:predicted tellurium resistance membrane protein TerC
VATKIVLWCSWVLLVVGVAMTIYGAIDINAITPHPETVYGICSITPSNLLPPEGTPTTGIALLLLGPVIAGTAIFTLRTMKGHTRNAAADEQAVPRLTAQQVRIVSLCSVVILIVGVVMTVYGFIDYADMGFVPSDLEWSVGGCGPSPTRGTPEAGLALLILGPLVIGMAVLMTFAVRSHAKASSAAQEAEHVTEHPRDDL